MVASSDRATSYAAYRREIEREPLVRALNRALIVLFVINTGFIVVDLTVYPHRFADFIPVRLILDVVLLFLFVVAVRRFPVSSTLATCGAGGWMLLTVIAGTGGAASDYYVGLVFLLIGIGVLVPLSARQGTLAIGTLFACYVAMVFLGEEVRAPERVALSLFALTAAAFMGVMSCAYLDRMRFSDFLQRQEIERARDELRELDVAKSRFTANIHHELRTPLTLTLAPVEAMLAGDFGELNDLQRGYLETVRSNGLRLLKLINNLLDLAKIESRQLEVKRRLIRVGEVVEEIVRSARPLAERKRVALTTSGLEQLPNLCADPEALEKVVVNLLGNALKFTDAGGRIEVAGTPEPDGGVRLVVADSGIGIPRDQLDRVFDRFAQVDGSTTRRHEGTGIGLSLAKELVELHGGRIHAESDGPGQGTRMVVVLPAGEPDEAEEDEAAEALIGGPSRTSLAAMQAEIEVEGVGEQAGAPADADGAATAPVVATRDADREALRMAEMQRTVERAESAAAGEGDASSVSSRAPADAPEVVVVEDNPDMRRLLAFLVGQEYRVRTARNGREGLALVRARRPDVVLTDVMMPEMSGTELCAALKRDPETAGIPVVLVTSKAEREMKIEGLEGGADDYVTKPFHPRELLARVRSLVRLRQMQEELAIRNALLESTNEELRSTMAELQEAGAQLVQAERLAAVGELAAGVAHEVNNPVNFALNAMKTLQAYVADVQTVAAEVAALDGTDPEKLSAQLAELEALRDRLDFERTAEALGELGAIVAEGLERTSRLVGDLRDFAAPGSRRTAGVDLARGLRSTLQLVSHSLAAARVTVETEIAPDLPQVEGDARALNQVFLNLVKNAAEAFEGRGGTLCVRACPEGGGVLVEIQDDGPGIPESVRPRVFEPFFTTKEAGRGSGLGLAISSRIVREHGGRIALDSAPGRGTRVIVHLPPRPPSPAPSATPGRDDAREA